MRLSCLRVNSWRWRLMALMLNKAAAGALHHVNLHFNLPLGLGSCFADC